MEEAIGHAAEAWIRCVRLEAQAKSELFPDRDSDREAWAATIRERASWAMNIYRELLRAGHNYGPEDWARVQAEHAAVLAILDGPAR